MSTHDVTKSSNPDVQALMVIILGLNARLQAVEFELRSLPQEYVVPGPKGEIPAGTVIVFPSMIDASMTPGLPVIAAERATVEEEASDGFHPSDWGDRG